MNEPNQLPQDSSPQQYDAQQAFAPPPPGYAAYPQPYPPQKQGMSGLKIGLIIVGVLFGVLMIGGLLVGVLAVATIPKLSEAKEKLEIKQMGDLQAGLRMILTDDGKKRRLKSKQFAEARGAELWIACLDKELLAPELGKKMTTLCGTDTASQSSPPPASSISFTAPQGSNLLRVLSSKGPERCVVFTWNSRNWRNLGGDRVPVMWSDAEMATFLTFEEAQSDYGITRAEWDDPAGQLFGKKAPFQHTYE